MLLTEFMILPVFWFVLANLHDMFVVLHSSWLDITFVMIWLIYIDLCLIYYTVNRFANIMFGWKRY